MPYIGNVLTSFAVETGNISDQAVTAPKLSATGGTDGQVLALDSNLNLEWVSDPAGQWVTSGSNIYYNDGNVGIGTTSPTTTLHVQQSAVSSAPSRSAALYLENNANCEIQFVGNASNDCQLRFGTTSNSFKGALEYELDNNNLKAYTNGSERLRIDSSGNVGINNTTPSSYNAAGS